MPKIILLHFLQLLIRNNYAREFFKDAIESSTLYIDEDKIIDSETKLYSLFFLNSICTELKFESPFDFIIENYEKEMPFDISFLIHLEWKDSKNKIINYEKDGQKSHENDKGERLY